MPDLAQHATMDTMTTRPDSPLTWHGRPILTITLAAARYGVDDRAMRQALRRPPLASVEPITPPPLDARTPAYDQAALDAAWAARPGRGANLRGNSNAPR